MIKKKKKTSAESFTSHESELVDTDVGSERKHYKLLVLENVTAGRKYLITKYFVNNIVVYCHLI